MYISRLVNVFEPDLDLLPEELKSALNETDIAAILNKADSFIALAKKAEFPWLGKLLQKCANSQSWHLEFTGDQGNPLVPYFRFFCGGMPAVSLPRTYPLRPDLPVALQHVYSLIGGFRENDFGYAGGVYQAKNISPIAESKVWFSEENKYPPDQAIAFMETFSGDQLCYTPDGRPVWYRHETGQLELKKNLEKEMGAYFEAILRGSRI